MAEKRYQRRRTAEYVAECDKIRQQIYDIKDAYGMRWADIARSDKDWYITGSRLTTIIHPDNKASLLTLCRVLDAAKTAAETREETIAYFKKKYGGI